jgi:hypothetical protein
MGHLGDQSLTAACAAMGSRHGGLGSSLVNEDQSGRIKPSLILLPLGPPPRDVGTILLAGVQAFFNNRALSLPLDRSTQFFCSSSASSFAKILCDPVHFRSGLFQPIDQHGNQLVVQVEALRVVPKIASGASTMAGLAT